MADCYMYHLCYCPDNYLVALDVLLDGILLGLLRKFSNLFRASLYALSGQFSLLYQRVLHERHLTLHELRFGEELFQENDREVGLVSSPSRHFVNHLQNWRHTFTYWSWNSKPLDHFDQRRVVHYSRWWPVAGVREQRCLLRFTDHLFQFPSIDLWYLHCSHD